jgi:MoaA/NifB/PqqE/SkfB family radical SAM enzyme
MKETDTYLETGKACLQRGDFAGAAEAFRKARAIEPDNAQVIFETGNLLARQGDEAGAADAYEKVLAADPAHVPAMIELGKLCARRKDEARARELLAQAARRAPGNYAAHLELGKLCWLRGEYAPAQQAFEAARRIEPGDGVLGSWLARSDEVPAPRREQSPYRVHLTWGMNYECNYRCSYCHAPKPEQPDFAVKTKFRTAYPGLKRIVEAWDGVADAYGSCRIRLDGGEPSVYPDFMAIVAHLSRRHWLQVNTNLSFDVERFCREIDPRHVRIDASFHSEYVPLDAFAAKIKTLKAHGFKLVVSFVAYPPFVDRIRSCKPVFGDCGVPFIIHPYSGEYGGKDYPRGYNAEEVKAIYNIDQESKGELEWRQDKTGAATEQGPAAPAPPPAANTVKRCRMGQMYARIYPSGDVFRCCTDDGLLSLGNLYAGSFRLLDEPVPCEHPGCRCWRCMTIGEEQRWLHTWLDDWEMPF